MPSVDSDRLFSTPKHSRYDEITIASVKPITPGSKRLPEESLKSDIMEKLNRPNTNTYMNLSNRFSLLSEITQSTNTTEVQMDTTTSDPTNIPTTSGTSNTSTSSASNTPTPAAAKVPPIVVGSKFYEQLLHTLKHHNISKYTLKFTSVGIRINIANIDEYKTILNTLKSPTHGMSYYTHDTNDMPQKFVIKGLPPQEKNDELLGKLAEINLVPTEIKKMTIKTPTYHNQSNYIIYFPKGTTKLSDLQKIKYVSNVVVVWQHYRSPKGPTQCHNCQMFGHGSRNCTLAAKCVKCGGNHQTSACTVDCNANNKQHLKCVNCNQQHAASYSQCPSRIEYVNMRHRQSTRNAPAAQRNISNTAPAAARNAPRQFYQPPPPLPPALNNTHFPSLPTFSSTLRQNSRPSTSNPHQRPANDHASQPNNNDLFNTQELFGIFQELTNKLKTCRSRVDQIQVITELAFNYCLTP